MDTTRRGDATMMPRVRALLVVLVLAACGGAARTDETPPLPSRGERPADPGARAAQPQCAADDGGLTLPAGFCALIAADSIGPARHIAVAPNGDVYVALRDRGGPGGIVGLRDTDGDGRFDQRVRFGSEGGTGIAVHAGHLYFATNTAVMRWRLTPDAGLRPSGEPEMMVSGLPEQRSHAAKTLAFDGRGSMWVNIGGPSNACQVQDRQHGSPGQDPCPELERQTGVWRFEDARAGQRQTDASRWATGIRNAMALAWHPTLGALYAVSHGRDMLDVIAPDEFNSADNAETPSEEFLRLERGSDFGHPYCYHDPRLGRRVLAPEYGGDGERAGRCADIGPPLYAYPAHWAPQALLFYDGRHFPARYLGGAFIAWHGSWNRAPHPQRGYQVTFQPMGADGRPAAAHEVFADGFTGRAVVERPQDAGARPMGLALAPDGSLYIVESVRGRVWRVFWRGS